MSQRDCGWIQLYAEQPGGGRPARAGVPPRRGALAAGDGVHGRLRPHPRLRAARPARAQEQVDAFLPPYEPRQVLDPDEPVTIGAMVGPGGVHRGRYLAHVKQMQALDLIPELAAELGEALGREHGRAAARLPLRGRARRSWWRSARCSARSRTRRRAARAGHERRRAGGSSLPARSRWRRCARRSAAPSAWSCSSRRSRSGSAGSSRRTCAPRSRAQTRRAHGDRRASAGARSRSRSLRRLLERGGGGAACSRLSFLDLNRELVERELERTREQRRSGSARGEHAARPRRRRRGAGVRRWPRDRSSSTRWAASRSATGCSTRAALGAGRPRPRQRDHQGPPRLPGLRRGARRALRARRRDARHRRPADRGQRDRLPGGLLDALPRVLVAAAVAALAVRQRARGRHRDRRGAAGQGPHATSASSARAATAAPSTSAWRACRACSSATTTCSTSATTTRPT